MSKFDDITKTSIKGSFLLVIGNLSATIIISVTGIIVARILGPDLYGLYSIALVIPSFFIILSDFGISLALTRFISYYQYNKDFLKIKQLIKNGLLFKICISFCFSIIVLFYAKIISNLILKRPDIYPFLQITCLYILGKSILMSINSIFIGLDRININIALINSRALLQSLVTLLLISLNLKIMGAIIGISSSFFFMSIIGLLIIYYNVHSKNFKNSEEKLYNSSSYDDVRILLIYGVPVYLSSLIIGLKNEIQKLYLTHFVSNYDIGFYAIALNFVSIIMMITKQISMGLFPSYSKLDIKQDIDMLKIIFQISVKYTSLIIIPISTYTSIMSSEIITLLYGVQYKPASIYLSLSAIIFSFTSIGMSITNVLFNSQNDTRITLKINIIKITLALFFSYILIPKFGVMGLIISIIVSEFLSIIYSLYKLHKTYKIYVDLRSSLKIIFITIIISSLIVILKKSYLFTNYIVILIMNLILYMIGYLILLPIFHIVNISELKNLNRYTKDMPFIGIIFRLFINIELKIFNILNKYS